MRTLRALRQKVPLNSWLGSWGTDIEFVAGTKESRRSRGLDAASLEWVSPTNRLLDDAPIPSRGGKSLPARTSKASYHRINSDDTASRGGFRFPGFSNDNGQCRQCTKLGSELVVIEEDLEYLRALALRNEFICSSCQPATPQLSVSRLNKSDRLLEEVTARHKAQLEQLTKDRVSSTKLAWTVFSFPSGSLTFSCL